MPQRGDANARRPDHRHPYHDAGKAPHGSGQYRLGPRAGRCQHSIVLDPLPDLTVITGDLVESGEVEEYDHWRTLVAPLHMPILAIPGNHDARAPMREAVVAETAICPVGSS